MLLSYPGTRTSEDPEVQRERKGHEGRAQPIWALAKSGFETLKGSVTPREAGSTW